MLNTTCSRTYTKMFPNLASRCCPFATPIPNSQAHWQTNPKRSNLTAQRKRSVVLRISPVVSFAKTPA